MALQMIVPLLTCTYLYHLYHFGQHVWTVLPSKAAIFSRLSETSQLQFSSTRLSTVASALVWSLAGSRGNLQKSLQNTDAAREPE